MFHYRNREVFTEYRCGMRHALVVAVLQIRPEDFALDLASVREQYRFYTDRFGAFL